jgi:hypothetical protein
MYYTRAEFRHRSDIRYASDRLIGTIHFTLEVLQLQDINHDSALDKILSMNWSESAVLSVVSLMKQSSTSLQSICAGANVDI